MMQLIPDDTGDDINLIAPLAERVAVGYEDITSSQVASNYLNVYQRYFAGRG